MVWKAEHWGVAFSWLQLEPTLEEGNRSIDLSTQDSFRSSWMGMFDTLP